MFSTITANKIIEILNSKTDIWENASARDQEATEPEKVDKEMDSTL